MNEERQERRGRSGGKGRGEKRFERRPRGDNEKKYHPRKSERKERTTFDVKLFNKWDSNVQVNDPSLKNYLNIEPRILPRSAGSNRGRFHKSKAHIVERLALNIMIPGHQGRRHRLSSGKFAGNYTNTLGLVEKAFMIIEKQENKNPIEVLVRAIENAALREEIISYQVGSIMAREAVVTAPQRRIDKTLRYFAQAAYRKSFNSKKKMAQALAGEIIAAYKNSSDSFAIKERERIEREAGGAR
jgi:small subunit ribosomal protein S7